MSTLVLTRCMGSLWTTGRMLGVLLSCTLLLLSCSSGGSGSVSSQTGPGAQVEQQAIEQLLDLYRTAIRQEDIDRLQVLVQSENTTGAQQALRQQSTPCQAGSSLLASGQQFLCDMSAAFHTSTITLFDIVPETVAVAPDRSSVAFQEVESVENSVTLTQQTRLFRTVLQLVRQDVAGLVTFRIVRVQRTGPLVQVSMQSQVQAGAPVRIEVTGTVFALAAVEVEVPETGVRQPLSAEGASFQGLVTSPQQTPSRPLQVHVRGTAGEQMTLSHVYRLRQAGEGTVHRIAGTGATRFSAVTVATDGTVWAGGDGVRLYRVAPGSTTAMLEGSLPSNLTGRVEDLVFDRLGRLHVVFVDLANDGVQGGGVVVHDPAQPDVFCQTVNVFDPRYPFRDPLGQLSASTRAIAAEGGDIWLFGSDGGVARVADGFRGGQCPTAGVEVRYTPLFRRADGGLLSNTVPALAVGAGGTLWFGTAFGLTRLRNGQFTPLPFAPGLSLQGNVTTLEAFFREVAQAIFAAQPLSTVQFGDVSFVEQFGSALVKEDLSFSAVEDAQGRLWLGTFGGGIRRIEGDMQTLHLTHVDGLPSNIIFSLAVGSHGEIWAATDAGVSRLIDAANGVLITTFTALDGLALPVRDVAVGPDGTAWLATDGGLFQITSQGGRIAGVVHDPTGKAVAEADVTVEDTELHAVTDTTGHFTLTNVPLGLQRLHIAGERALSGPFTMALRDVMVTADTQLLAVTLAPRASGVRVDPVQGGTISFSGTSGAEITIVPGTVLFPGVAPELRLTLLPPAALTSPLPVGFTAGAAAELLPDGTTFAVPAQLTLPNQGKLPAGQLVSLLRLDEATLTYEQIGFGQVSVDGTVITTISGGLTHLSTVVFASSSRTAQATLVAAAGDGQTGSVGRSLPQPFVVAVRDEAGQGVPGVRVTFTMTMGQDTVGRTTISTDAQGQAAAVLTLGVQVGAYQVSVTAPGVLGSPVLFTATGVTCLPFELVAGNGQSGVVGTTLPDPLVVAVKDDNCTPVPDVPVTFTVTSDQGSLLTPQPIRTDAQGQAMARLMLGRRAGSNNNVVTATGPGANAVTFAATGVTGPPARPTVQGPSTAVVNTPVSLVVQILDAFDNPIVGVPIQLRILTGNGHLSPTLVTTDNAGQSEPFILTVGTTAGPNEFEAGVPGLTAVFNVTGVADRRRSRLIEVSGNNQTGISGQELPEPLVVRLEDQFENPVSGERVTADIIRGMGQLLQAEVQTEQGRAEFRLRIAPEMQDHVVVQIAAPELENVEPVQFVAVVARVQTSCGDIAVDAPDSVVVVDCNTQTVVRVNPNTNSRTVVPCVGISTDLITCNTTDVPGIPQAITVERDGSLVVAEAFPATVVRLPATGPQKGQRVMITDPSSCTDFPEDKLFDPQAIAVEGNGAFVVAQGAFGFGLPAVVRVDALGQCIPVSDLILGGDFLSIRSIAVDQTDGSLILVDDILHTLVRVDPMQGSGTVDSRLPFPRAVAFDEANGALIVVDQDLRAVVRVDQNGLRTISGCTVPDIPCPPDALMGEGPLFVLPEAVAVEPNGPLWVLDGQFNAVIRVDIQDGKRFIVHFLSP